MFARRDQEAVEQSEKTLEMDPSFGPAHWVLAWTYRHQNRQKEFARELEKSETLGGGAPIGFVSAALGKEREARRALEHERAAPKRYSVQHNTGPHVRISGG